MQTFLPYKELHKSAFCLDNLRLNKQCVETVQIYKAITDPEYGWQNHPAVNMWRKYENYLILYGVRVCNEYKKRFGKLHWAHYQLLLPAYHIFEVLLKNEICKPKWLGYKPFHDSHRSNLLRKNPEWYGKFNWKVPDNLPYYWPTKEESWKSND